MTCVNFISLIGWLMLGTVSQTMLYCLKQLTLLNHDLINFGNIRIMIYDFQAELHGTGMSENHRTPQDTTGHRRTHRRKPQDITGHRRTPQDTTGHTTGHHRKPQDTAGHRRTHHRTPE